MMVDIRDSVISILKTNFPDHKTYDEKVTQGLKRPCFFVDLIPVDVDDSHPNVEEHSMFIDVQYMSKEDTKEKNLEMIDKLRPLFKILEFSGLRVSSSNKRFETIDGILHFLFDLDFTLYGKQDENLSTIGSVNLNKEVLRWGSHK
jgi:hypothetical protein